MRTLGYFVDLKTEFTHLVTSVLFGNINNHLETFLYQTNKSMNNMCFEADDIVSKSIMFPCCVNHDRNPVAKTTVENKS